MTVKDALRYHDEQISTFFYTPADMVTAITMNYSEEAIGIALAAKQNQMPVAISYTVETNGNLPTGQCCGTDHRHIEQISKACRPLFKD